MNKNQEEKLREDWIMQTDIFTFKNADGSLDFETIADYWIAQLTTQKERIVKKIEEKLIYNQTLELNGWAEGHYDALSDLKSDIINDKF